MKIWVYGCQFEGYLSAINVIIGLGAFLSSSGVEGKATLSYCGSVPDYPQTCFALCRRFA